MLEIIPLIAMSEKITGKIIWNNAAKAGLALGLVSVAYMFITMATGKIPSKFLSMSVNTLLWLAKFIGCIYLMRYFMIRLVKGYSEVTNSHTYTYGIAIALLSALICSFGSLVNMVYINSDLIAQTFQTALQQYAGMMDSNTMEAVENIMPKLPMISFFGTLIYCFLYGTLLSFILSRNIPSNSPFDIFNEPDD